MPLNRYDVEVIQHGDKAESGILINSTTIKVATLIDGEDKLFVLLTDGFFSISEEMDDNSTLDFDSILPLWKIIVKEIKKDYPDKNQDEVEVIAHDILYAIQGTKRKTTHVFRGPKGIYHQIKSRGNYLVF